ncbi:MAG: DUF2480 family protein [Flavobacteriaceae bacterium]|jgi:hypothetical protein|tara:strand:+ start:696 stop:1202 length:507 start_codon:yes stop_codon:yes gene_type:complete
MDYKIINRVSKSKIMTIDFNDFLGDTIFEVIDLKNWLKDEFILIESDFREKIKSFNWEVLKEKTVLIQCSNDAIIPHWAYLLISSKLTEFEIKNFIGNQNEFKNYKIIDGIKNLDEKLFIDKPVIIKGCSDISDNNYFYSLIIEKLQPIVKSIMFGEACSAVPVFKKK